MIYKERYSGPLSEVVTLELEAAVASGPEFDGMDPNEEEW